MPPVPVINTIVYRGNPYNRMLYAGPSRRYAMVPGSVAGALHALRSGERTILHLHWEEGFLRECRTAKEADIAAYSLAHGLHAFVSEGGRLVWTVHNAVPHEAEHLELFLRLRAGIARFATRILVHGETAIPTLAAQCDLDPAKVAVLPHPSYLGVYEPEEATLAGGAAEPGARLLFFGRIRPYKGVDLLLEAARLAPDVEIDIVGEPMAGESREALGAAMAGLPSLRPDFRFVADAEIPALFRGARGLVLPYRRFLTSGVALLALTFGTPLIAPDVPQMRDILPSSAHPFLYAEGDAAALAGRMRELRDLPAGELGAIRADLLARAESIRPSRIGERLFDLFDTL